MDNLKEINNGGVKVEKLMDEVILDEEWIYLIQTAKKLGISIEEIRLFLERENKEASDAAFWCKE